jgi:hypothetical protein
MRIMTTIADIYPWRPSFEQELLLKASLLHGSSAQQAFEAWIRSVEIEELDSGSRRLLPLLYDNLKGEGIDHSFLVHCKKVYLEAWAKNRTLFGKITPLLQDLHKGGINTLVFKGVSLIVRYYRNFGLRPMSDFDILVPVQKALEAFGLLQKNGWTPRSESARTSPSDFMSIRHSCLFKNETKTELDLHWHILRECLGQEADDDFWEAADPLEINGFQTLCLTPADELFLICIHGSHWSNISPIRWITDAVMIIQSGLEIDWNRITAQAQKRRLILPIRTALLYLKDNFDIFLPPAFLKDLYHLPVSREELKEYKTRTLRRPSRVTFLPSEWLHYDRIAKDIGWPTGLAGFVKYLQNYWELENPQQVFAQLGRLAIKGITKPRPKRLN